MEVVSGAIGQIEHIVAMLIMLMTTGSINGTVTVCNGINYIMIKWNCIGEIDKLWSIIIMSMIYL